MKLKDNNLGSLEYRCRKSPKNRRRQWGFKFKSSDGEIVLQSGSCYPSLAKAERGFYGALKLMATNQYKVDYPVNPGSSRS